MDEQEIQERLADPTFQQTVFNNLMEVFVLPNIKRRQEKGELPDPLHLMAAQVLIYPDERPTEVRVNEEVRAIAEMKLKPDVEVMPGDPIYTHQLESVSNFRLTEDDDPDCGYIILLQIEGRWTGNFNFIYNRGLSQKHIKAARQFFETAKYALEKRYWPVFVDTLFSASELAVKALMMGHHADLRHAKKHNRVHSVFNQFARMGNVEEEQRDTFNQLSQLRPTARYLHKDVEFNEAEAQQMLETVREMIEGLEVFLNRIM